MATAVDYLAALLRSRLIITEAQVLTSPPGAVHARHVVAFPKLMLVYDGAIEYQIDGQLVRLHAGDMFYRPAASAARWTLAPGQTCSIGWCEFRAEPELDEPHHPLLRATSDVPLELASFHRIRDLYQRDDAPSRLTVEGELKAVLGRFLPTATPLFDETISDGFTSDASRGDDSVRQAVAWLGRHFAEASVATKVRDRTGLSPDHFRRVFKEMTGLSPNGYLLRLRMSAARFYLQRSDLSIKQVAAQVGYADPLYFSRLYRRYWKSTPTADRKRQ
ncbi:MAG TPA: AraC family transcriptional regulator [Tepidisphaeraceae bacterium]|jgi:AraC-like DNA-binding protein|nr:AraC family transcriptional regulator [Tepidisphaeraceae bacterium]